MIFENIKKRICYCVVRISNITELAQTIRLPIRILKQYSNNSMKHDATKAIKTYQDSCKGLIYYLSDREKT